MQISGGIHSEYTGELSYLCHQRNVCITDVINVEMKIKKNVKKRKKRGENKKRL